MRRIAGVLLVLSMLVGTAGPASAAPLLEKDVNLDESNRLRDILVSHGVEVVMTRTTDVNPAIPDRARMGGQGDLLVSVHNNSSGNRAARGSEVYAQINNPESMQLAERILEGMVNRAGTPSRGARIRPGERGDFYAILRHSPVPAVLVEGAFLSNPDEAAALASPEFRQRLAQGIADGIFSVIARAERLGNGPTPPKSALLLGAPPNLRAPRVGAGISVSWGVVGLATGYEVWKDGGLVGTVTSTSFHDPSPGPGRHTYEVRGFVGLGDLRAAEGPTAAIDTGGARVVIDPGHGGADPGAIGNG